MKNKYENPLKLYFTCILHHIEAIDHVTIRQYKCGHCIEEDAKDGKADTQDTFDPKSQINVEIFTITSEIVAMRQVVGHGHLCLRLRLL